MALVSVAGLTRIFDVSKPWLNRVIERREKAYLTAVSDVSFEIAEKTVYSLVGESGSGKSTLVCHVNRLIEPTGGEILINGANVGDLNAEDLRAMRADGRLQELYDKYGLENAD